MNEYANGAGYHRVLASRLDRRPVSTSVPIVPWPDCPFGCGKQAVNRTLGKADVIVMTPDALGTKIFFYRRRQGDIRLRFELHLDETGVFFARRVFRYLTPQSCEAIVGSVGDKYVGTAAGFDDKNEKVVSEEGDELIITSASGLGQVTAEYLRPSSAFFTMINSAPDETAGRTGIYGDIV
ncbi:MAG: hypothetical protein LJE69_16265 [Thiohalocapsa sp.]|uniref:hypothetical protein n=1 Tax=Thiohalocapsa sp. TaxID=2497641 RepID=UPI0025DB75AF|nr:hypothetical protein [Thiohalocapsa sp.]MCG6942792.1 hypothetical protein [Thiohalocapsa sp.]